ncbi:MAG: MotA/TolQ/ExbB proton channel family protein [Candidatus Omnitrophica bacterium]|nr:MotA/TolQ/ExbB proton channel family protein [Candidatus Omnitrophota bacterium]
MYNFFIKGGPLMWPIALCSVVSAAFIMERLSFFYRTRPKSKNLDERVLDLLKAGKGEDAASLSEKDGSFLGRFLSVGIKIAGHSADDRQKILRRAGSRELEDGEKHLRILSTIGNISTLLGLTGTVTGMIQTFMKIERIGGVADVTVLAGGIWEALLTTAAGLFVAIPTLTFYYYFEGVVDGRAIQLRNVASDVFGIH